MSVDVVKEATQVAKVLVQEVVSDDNSNSELATSELQGSQTYGRAQSLRKFDAPSFAEMKKPVRDRMKADLEEAENLITNHFNGTFFTVPSTGLNIGIVPISEASWQRFFLQTRTETPPRPPDKMVTDRSGRKIATPNYDDDNFQRYLGVFEIHQGNVRQAQVGEMLEYIYDRGTVVEIPNEWISEYEANLPVTVDLSHRELKHIYITENMTTGGETKAVQILICGRDPLGFGEDDEEEDGSTNE